MLTRLRFKNWRSLRDVTIDLSPITVFIGANSSGKTNIVDALRFYRDAHLRGLVPVVFELGFIRIQTDALRNDGRVELGFTYRISDISSDSITDTIILEFDKRDVPFKYARKLREGHTLLRDADLQELPLRNLTQSIFVGDDPDRIRRGEKLLGYLNDVIEKRWQILGDSFSPLLRLSSREAGSPYVIEPDARNLLLILSFMQQSYPELFGRLQDDFRWILQHVSELDFWQHREEGMLELLVREAEGRAAPTVSAGTARVLAMLTAFYALDMPQQSSSAPEANVLSPSMPGLVVIEEPDTALNPGILRNFVEQLRYFTTGEYPRQVILTTHNPRFLDYFEPEEVRVVERDEQGYTSVNPVPDHIREIWLDKYTLGEVWMTNSFGALAE